MKPTFSQLEVTLQNPVPEVERLLPENLHRITRQKKDNHGRPVFSDPMGTIPVYEQVLFPALRYAHIDLSKSGDATGLVVAHAVGSRRIERFDPAGSNLIYENMPIIRVDLALCVIAPPDDEIDIPRVRSILYQLRYLGMEFGLVTLDTFGSQESVKALKDAGFPADIYSVDREFTPWEEMKQALYDNRIMYFEFPHLEMELAQLERTLKKIDHPPRGSKDIADCLAAVVHHVEEGWRKGMGAQGMFQIGLVEGARPTPSPELPESITKVVPGQDLGSWRRKPDRLWRHLGVDGLDEQTKVYTATTRIRRTKGRG